jgi:hypothetical protein
MAVSRNQPAHCSPARHAWPAQTYVPNYAHLLRVGRPGDCGCRSTASMPQPALPRVVEGRTWPAGARDACAGRRGEVASCMCSCTPSDQRIGARTELDGPPLPRRRFRRIQCAAASAMDMGVASQQKLPAEAGGAAPAAGAGAGSKAGGGGRKHLSSIANHVLRQCSLCVSCSSSLFGFVDFVQFLVAPVSFKR